MARTPALSALVASFLALVSACSFSPQTDVPEPLAGEWSNGTVSMIDYYNPTTGSWAPTTGSGFSYDLHEDGTYVFGGLLQSSMYGCTMKVFQYTEGTVVVEDNLVTLHPTYDRVKLEDNCSESSNYEKDGTYEVQSFYWEVVQDEYGSITLIFYATDTGEEYSRYTRL